MQLNQPSLRSSLKSALKNRPFVFGAGIFLLTWVAIDILQTTLLYFLKYVVQREAQSDLIMATIFVTAMLVLPLWVWVSKRWGKRQAYIGGIAFWGFVQLLMITLNPGTDMFFILFLCVMAGIGISAAHVLPWSILPDAVEWDEYETGERHEGVFYSLITLFQKVASSLAIPLALLIMDASGYAANAAQQTPQALWGIRLVIGPVPALLLAIGIAFAFFYPLSRERHSQIIQELQLRRKKISAEVE